jgi:hypothetical protein
MIDESHPNRCPSPENKDDLGTESFTVLPLTSRPIGVLVLTRMGEMLELVQPEGGQFIPRPRIRVTVPDWCRSLRCVASK